MDLSTATRGHKIGFFVFFGFVLLFIGGVYWLMQKLASGEFLRPGTLFHGTVVGADGSTGVGGARVRLQVEYGNARVPEEASSKPDGRFELNVWDPERFADRPVPLSIVVPGYQVLETEVTLDEDRADLGRHVLTPLPPAEPRTKTVTVVGPEVDTGIEAVGGETLEITASGNLVFRGATSVNPRVDRGPEGEGREASGDDPAPALRSRSLLFRVGDVAWQQGGTRVVHVAERTGKVLLRANGATVTEDPKGWSVTITVRREPAAEAPPPR